MTQRSFVIELLGPPASGKSGLARDLARVGGVQVVKDQRGRDRVALLWSAVRAGRVLWSASRPEVRWTRWMAWAGRLQGFPSVVRRRLGQEPGTVVLDQGPAYTLGRMAALHGSVTGHDDAWWTARLADSADLLDLLVVLDADPETLAVRLRRRQKAHRAQDYDDPAAQAYLLRERSTCARVAELLEDRGVPVLRLDTGATPRSGRAGLVLRALHPARAEQDLG